MPGGDAAAAASCSDGRTPQTRTAAPVGFNGACSPFGTAPMEDGTDPAPSVRADAAIDPGGEGVMAIYRTSRHSWYKLRGGKPVKQIVIDRLRERCAAVARCR